MFSALGAPSGQRSSLEGRFLWAPSPQPWTLKLKPIVLILQLLEKWLRESPNHVPKEGGFLHLGGPLRVWGVFRVAIPGILPLLSALGVSCARLQARRVSTGFRILLAMGWVEEAPLPGIGERCRCLPRRRLLQASHVWLLFSQGRGVAVASGRL